MDKRLLEIMACPKCNGDIKEDSMFLTCRKCRLAFPVLEDRVPDMLIEDAWELGRAKRAKFRHKLRL